MHHFAFNDFNLYTFLGCILAIRKNWQQINKVKHDTKKEHWCVDVHKIEDGELVDAKKFTRYFGTRCTERQSLRTEGLKRTSQDCWQMVATSWLLEALLGWCATSVDMIVMAAKNILGVSGFITRSDCCAYIRIACHSIDELGTCEWLRASNEGHATCNLVSRSYDTNDSFVRNLSALKSTW